MTLVVCAQTEYKRVAIKFTKRIERITETDFLRSVYILQGMTVKTFEADILWYQAGGKNSKDDVEERATSLGKAIDAQWLRFC